MRLDPPDLPLAHAEVGRAHMKLVVLEDCDLPDAGVRHARFELVEMPGCRLDGLRGASKLFSAACGAEVVD